MKISTIESFLRYELMYCGVLNESSDRLLSIQDKKQFIVEYFKHIDKQYISEGIIETVKNFIKFCFDAINTFIKVIKDKTNNNKIVQKAKQDKDIVLAAKMLKGIGRSASFMAVTRISVVSGLIKTVSSFAIKALGAVGIAGTPAAIIGSIVAYSVASKVISTIIKLIKTIIGAVKKWAGVTDDERKNKEAIELAEYSIAANKNIAKNLDGKKRERAMEEIKKKEQRLNDYKKKLAEKQQTKNK